MQRILVIFFLIGLFVGCASPKAVPVKYTLDDSRKYVPINLNITSDKNHPNYDSQAVDYIYESLNRSNLFSRIRTSRNKYQYSLNINYSWENPMTLNAFAGAMISASTMLLIPTKNQEMHSIDVQILDGKKVIYSSIYNKLITTTFSMYHNVIEDRKNGINRILREFYEDIEVNKLIPRNSELNSSVNTVANEVSD
ncbi:MAG: hypothetical protein AB2731_18895 [Candidatus Thiodiazotropha sp.]